MNALDAPWKVLLAPNLPLGIACGWGPRDIMMLRATCTAMCHTPTHTLLSDVLRYFGLRGDFERLSAQHAFLLCTRVHIEVSFIYAVHAQMNRAGAGCVFAGSYALQRMLLLDEAGCARDDPPSWNPGDVDVFVSGCRESDGENYNDDHPWGAEANSAIGDVIDLARAFLLQLYPRSGVSVEAHDAYRQTMDGDSVAFHNPDPTA